MGGKAGQAEAFSQYGDTILSDTKPPAAPSKPVRKPMSKAQLARMKAKPTQAQLKRVADARAKVMF